MHTDTPYTVSNINLTSRSTLAKTLQIIFSAVTETNTFVLKLIIVQNNV